MGFGITGFSIRSITRRPARSGALALGMAALAGALFTLGLMYISVTGSVERGAMRLGADAVAVAGGWRAPEGGLLLSSGPTGAFLNAEQVERIASYEGVEAASEQLFIVSASLPCCSMANTVLVGFSPGTDLTVSPWLRENLGRPLDGDEIVVGSSILSEAGGRIRFFDKVFRVAARLEPTGMPLMDNAVFIPMPEARRMISESPNIPARAGPGEVSAVLLRFGPDVNHNARALRMEFDMPGISVMLASEAVEAARHDMLSPLRGMAAMAALWWAVSLVLSGVLYGVDLEARQGEIVLLRALGATRKRLVLMFSLEVLMLSVAGSLAGLAGGWMALPMLSGGLPLPHGRTVMLMALLTAGLCIASSSLATAYPLFRGSSVAPSASSGRSTGQV